MTKHDTDLISVPRDDAPAAFRTAGWHGPTAAIGDADPRLDDLWDAMHQLTAQCEAFKTRLSDRQQAMRRAADEVQNIIERLDAILAELAR